MSKRWSDIQVKLQKLTPKERTKTFNDFINQHPKLADHTVESLRLIVVKLKSQAAVSKDLGLHKQIVNRVAANFKHFFTKKKVI